MNGDGHPDLVAAMINEVGTNSLNALAVMINSGSGAFTTEIDGSPENPGALAALDLDGDGKLDLIVGCGPDVYSNQAYISVIFGRGTGSLAEVEERSATKVQEVVAGDVNGDGKVDLVVAGFGQLAVYLGDGHGLLTQWTSTAAGTVANIALADVNGDGFADVVGQDLSGHFVVLPGNGKGKFVKSQSTSPGLTSLGFAVGDFNGDGLSDVAIRSVFTNQIQVLWGSKSGGMISGPILTTAYGSAAINVAMTAGDFNGDGIQDLAVSTYDFSTVNSCFIEVFPGAASGTFGAEIISPAPVNGTVAAADMNNDGKADVVLTGVDTGSFPDFNRRAARQRPGRIHSSDIPAVSLLDGRDRYR